MDQNLGTYDTVSLDTILAGVRMRLGMRDTTSDDMLLKDLIVEMVKRMGSPQMFVRAQAYLDIDGPSRSAKLPPGFKRFEHYNPIRFVGDDGKVDPHNFFGPQYINNTFFRNDPGIECAYSCIGTVTESNGFLFFSNDITADRCYISFLSANYDSQGNIVIRQDMESPLMDGVMWQYGLIYPDRVPMAVTQTREMSYKQNKKAIKGSQNLPSSLESKLNQWIMNSMI